MSHAWGASSSTVNKSNTSEYVQNLRVNESIKHDRQNSMNPLWWSETHKEMIGNHSHSISIAGLKTFQCIFIFHIPTLEWRRVHLDLTFWRTPGFCYRLLWTPWSTEKHTTRRLTPSSISIWDILLFCLPVLTADSCNLLLTNYTLKVCEAVK